MKNLLPVVALVAEMANVGDKMGRSKGTARFAHLASLYDEGLGILSVDWTKVDDEWRVARSKPEAMAEIQKVFADKFDIVSDKLELAIEEGLLLVKENYELIQKNIAFVQKVKSL